jgi:sec-independent protein translocase protein TatA
MGFGSIWPWLIVLAVVLLLFGRGKVSELMGDVAKGVKSFRSGLAEDDQPQQAVEHAPAETVNASKEEEKSGTNAG